MNYRRVEIRRQTGSLIHVLVRDDNGAIYYNDDDHGRRKFRIVGVPINQNILSLR